MCHRTKFARGDGVQPTRCSCRSMPHPMRARNTRRCPHDAHKDLAALEIVCTPRCCDCLLKGEAQSHPQSGGPGGGTMHSTSADWLHPDRTWGGSGLRSSTAQSVRISLKCAAAVAVRIRYRTDSAWLVQSQAVQSLVKH
jgi:hypothetical protein